MEKEEKELLIKDLCGRLTYGVQGITLEGEISPLLTRGEADWDIITSLNYRIVKHGWKPYLRPMSSMTKEEKKIMRSCGFELILYDTGYTGFANIENCIDEVSFIFMEEFLNAHHFDYRGLIPMGLALEAIKDMYNPKN